MNLEIMGQTRCLGTYSNSCGTIFSKAPTKRSRNKPKGSKIFCFHCAVWTVFLCFPLNVILWQGKQIRLWKFKVLLDRQGHFQGLDINPELPEYLIFQASWINIPHTISHLVHNSFFTHTRFAFPEMYEDRILFVLKKQQLSSFPK